VVGHLVDGCLAPLDHDDVELLGQAAHVGEFSTVAIAAIDPGLLDRWRRAGLPIEETTTHRWRMINPLRDILRERVAPDRSCARQLAMPLVQSGLAVPAIRVLLRAGLVDDAAGHAAALTANQVDESPAGELLASLDLLGMHGGTSSRVHLVRARVLGNLARVDDQLAELAAAVAAATADGDDAVLVEATAQRLHLEAVLGVVRPDLEADLDRVAERLRSTSAPAGALLVVETRCLLLARSQQPADLEEALVLSERVAAGWRVLGDRNRLASSLRLRALAMFMPLGRLADATAAIDEVLARR